MEVFYKKDTVARHRCFPINFAKFLRTVFTLFMIVSIAYAKNYGQTSFAIMSEADVPNCSTKHRF